LIIEILSKFYQERQFLSVLRCFFPAKLKIAFSFFLQNTNSETSVYENFKFYLFVETDSV